MHMLHSCRIDLECCPLLSVHPRKIPRLSIEGLLLQLWSEHFQSKFQSANGVVG